MTKQVTGDQYEELDGKLFEIKRQMRQKSGYPYDPRKLSILLQRAIEGVFDSAIRIDRSRLFDPKKSPVFGPGWTIVEEDARSLAIHEVADLRSLLPTHLTRSGVEEEIGIDNAVGLSRLGKKTENKIRLDVKFFEFFLEKKSVLPEDWQEFTLFFPGTIFKSPENGLRYIPVLYFVSGEGWAGDKHCLDEPLKGTCEGDLMPQDRFLLCSLSVL